RRGRLERRRGDRHEGHPRRDREVQSRRDEVEVLRRRPRRREDRPHPRQVRVTAASVKSVSAMRGPCTWCPSRRSRSSSLRRRTRAALLSVVRGAGGAVVFLLVQLGALVLRVGASAGIYAVFGAYGRLYPRDRVTLFLPIPGVPSLPVVEVVVIFLILEPRLGLLGPLGIAWEAHVGALIFGFATAPFFMRLPLRGGRGRLIPVKAIADLATPPDLQRILGEAE